MVNMFGRFARLTTVIVAALSPALAWAQYDPYMPPPYAMAGYPPPVGMADGGYPIGQTRYTQLPDDNGWAFGDTHLERLLKETFRHAYFRLEYLNWSFSDPGNVTLGGPVFDPTNVNNPLQDTSIPFDIFDPVTGNFLGQGISPSLDGVKGIHNNGIRGTWGFNFEPFSLEASIFALQTAKATVHAGNLPIVQETDILGNVTNVGLFVVQGVLVNGVPTADSYLIYDRSYSASVQTGIWGADGKVLLASYDTGGPLSLQPLFGVRFLNFNERVDQSGVFSTPELVTGAGDPVLRRINAATQNYLYGPQFGFRAELPSKWVTIGAQPTMMFGVNSYRSTLTTQQIADANEAQFYDRIVKTTFGPVFDLQVYANTHLSEHLSIFVAYNLVWAGSITRPGDNVVYNVTSTGNPSNFFQDVQFSDLLIQGVSVGGEIRW
jgi:hypothetical protein